MRQGMSRAPVIRRLDHDGRTIREVAREKSGIPAERLEQLLDPRLQVG